MLYEYFVMYFQTFLIIMVRILGLFITAPFFSGLAMPMRFRLPLAFFCSLLSVPLVIEMGYKIPSDLIEFGVKLLSSFIFGVGVGYFVFIIISAFQVSSQIFSIQMGLGMNEVFDPISEAQVPAIGNVFGILILLLLLRVDGHFYLIQLIVDSFKNVDLLSFNSFGLMVKSFLFSVVAMLEVGLKISLPIVGATILMDVAMGIISRVAPQFNVMIMGFNLKLLVGFFAIWFAMPAIVDLGGTVVSNMIKTTGELIRYFKT